MNCANRSAAIRRKRNITSRGIWWCSVEPTLKTLTCVITFWPKPYTINVTIIKINAQHRNIIHSIHLQNNFTSPLQLIKSFSFMKIISYSYLSNVVWFFSKEIQLPIIIQFCLYYLEKTCLLNNLLWFVSKCLVSNKKIKESCNLQWETITSPFKYLKYFLCPYLKINKLHI